MSLLSTEQVEAASEPALYATLLAIRQRLVVVEEANLLSEVRAWLVAHRVPGVARVTFVSGEWANGNFYEVYGDFEDAWGRPVHVNDDTSEALAALVSGTLANLSDLHGPLMEGEAVTVDTRAGAVTRG